MKEIAAEHPGTRPTEAAGRALILFGARSSRSPVSPASDRDEHRLFATGVLVTVLVAVGAALPIYGAILDGRYRAERATAEVRELSNKRTGRRSAA